MLYNFCYLFLLFMFYAVLGYIVEISYCSLTDKKITFNRGFLIGPYLPIYGSCLVLMYLFLVKYENDLSGLFIMSAVLSSIIEFFTSLILEKIFKVRWWDYSNLRFNIDGRICLNNSLLFGLGGVIIIRFVNPYILRFLDSLSSTTLITISLILLVIFITDLIISVVVLVKIKVSSMNFGKVDVSEEIRKLRSERLKKNSLLTKRLLNAFPKIEGKNKEQFEDLKRKVNEIRKKLKEQKNVH